MVTQEALQTYVDREQIKDLKSRYIWAMDANDAEGVLDVFTEDAEFYGQHIKTNEPYIRQTGHDEIRAMVEKRATRTDIDFIHHRAFTPRIEIDGDTAHGNWYMTNLHFLPDGTLELQYGYYADGYRRVDGDWKISHLTAEFTLVEPALRD